MLCEKCRLKPANVHLTHKVPASGSETLEIESEHHFCQECADQFKRSSPLFNPILDPKRPILIDETSDANPSVLTYAGSPGTRTERLRVEEIAPERIVLRVINSDEVWMVLPSRLKGIHGWAVGTEIGMSLTAVALEWLQGKRESQYE